MQQAGGFGETLTTGLRAEGGVFQWQIVFTEAYILKERTRDLLDDFLNDHQTREESVKVYKRRKESVANRLNYDAEAMKDPILDGLRPEYKFMVCLPLSWPSRVLHLLRVSTVT